MFFWNTNCTNDTNLLEACQVFRRGLHEPIAAQSPGFQSPSLTYYPQPSLPPVGEGMSSGNDSTWLLALGLLGLLPSTWPLK